MSTAKRHDRDAFDKREREDPSQFYQLEPGRTPKATITPGPNKDVEVMTTIKEKDDTKVVGSQECCLPRHYKSLLMVTGRYQNSI